jgi:hypothetical protein
MWACPAWATYRYLTSTAVAGDVRGLAPLVKLSSLWLDSTSVSGDAKGLDPLSQLTELRLTDTAVTRCTSFCKSRPAITTCDCP